MNKLFVFFLLTVTFVVHGQTNLDRATRFINAKDTEIKDSKNKMIISNEGLNVFFAKQINAYLSGSSDLSLYKAYFVLDQPSKRLFLGYNISRNPATSLKRPWNVVTIGLSSAYGDDFSNLYTAQQLSNDLGISTRFTILGKGVVSFDAQKQWERNIFFSVKPVAPTYSHKDRMNFHRQNAMKELIDKKDKEAKDFESSITSVTDPTYKKELQDEFYSEANETLISDYLNREATLLEKPKSHHWFWTYWFTADVYLPITKTQYAVAPSLTSKIDTVSLKNTRVSIIANMLADNRWCRLLVSAAYGWRNNNGITTDDFKKYNFAQYKKLGGTDTLRLAQLKNQEAYVGSYETFVSPFVRGQIVFFPKIENKPIIGISLLAEKFSGKYNPLNIRIGIPFSIKGKEDGKPVNFELQGKWDDINGDINPGSPKSKFVFGVSLGLALTSKVY